jgi:hypothetical protein
MGHAKSPGLSVRDEHPARTRNEKNIRMMIAFILPPGFWFNGKFIRTICSNVLKDSVGFKWCFDFFYYVSVDGTRRFPTEIQKESYQKYIFLFRQSMQKFLEKPRIF